MGSGPRQRRRVLRMSRQRLGLAAVALGLSGAWCEPGSVRVTALPPPALVDERGRVDADAFAALVAAAEEQRGLGFIQRPTLELLAADDPRLPALRDAVRALQPCPRAASAPSPPRAGEGGAAPGAAPDGACFPDPGLERVLCLAPPDRDAASRALLRLLDAQNYPRLARAAPELRGDPGVAVRSLLAASVQREAMVGIAPAPGAAPYELLDQPALEVRPQAAAADVCEAMALSFIAGQRDREAPFRAPPLSTKQLVSPRAWAAGERPLLLVGSPPELAGCRVVDDESVGVARLLVERLAKGGTIPGRSLASWAGDRGIRFDCADGRRPWIYVALVRDEAAAAPFAADVRDLLPAEFAGEPDTATFHRRVVLWSGLTASRARAFATTLRAQELVHLPGPDGLD